MPVAAIISFSMDGWTGGPTPDTVAFLALADAKVPFLALADAKVRVKALKDVLVSKP